MAHQKYVELWCDSCGEAVHSHGSNVRLARKENEYISKKGMDLCALCKDAEIVEAHVDELDNDN